MNFMNLFIYINIFFISNPFLFSFYDSLKVLFDYLMGFFFSLS